MFKNNYSYVRNYVWTILYLLPLGNIMQFEQTGIVLKQWIMVLKVFDRLIYQQRPPTSQKTKKLAIFFNYLILQRVNNLFLIPKA